MEVADCLVMTSAPRHPRHPRSWASWLVPRPTVAQYFEPYTADTLGSRNQSWTAASLTTGWLRATVSNRASSSGRDERRVLATSRRLKYTSAMALGKLR